VTNKLDKTEVCDYFNAEIERHVLTVTSKIEAKPKEEKKEGEKSDHTTE
jgi:hypothetical protein